MKGHEKGLLLIPTFQELRDMTRCDHGIDVEWIDEILGPNPDIVTLDPARISGTIAEIGGLPVESVRLHVLAIRRVKVVCLPRLSGPVIIDLLAKLGLFEALSNAPFSKKSSLVASGLEASRNTLGHLL